MVDAAPVLEDYLALNPLERLLRLLDLETIDRDLYRGFHPPDRNKRLFGGQIIAQALIAAIRTVDDDRLPHYLHAYGQEIQRRQHSLRWIASATVKASPHAE